ncbi:hypothetical protein IHE45_07G002900 [Dioscorea alata]|uniref:Uncharacterized protein n=1 Tax=Dioscorea alata TaxID=55571 RepID=A0ACB7VP97_DIOAL|nr:hypothetical protein IHE45_07G002900 [Dioscorea alata]
MRNKAPPTNTSVVERWSSMELLKFINGNGDGDVPRAALQMSSNLNQTLELLVTTNYNHMKIQMWTLRETPGCVYSFIPGKLNLIGIL